MRFLQPTYLKLFYLLAALFPLWLYRFSVKRSTRRSLGDSELLSRTSNLSPLWRECGRYLLLNLVLAALILALARPQLAHEKLVSEPRKMDIIFLLDSSPSMRASDISPSRLEKALEVIGSFSRRKLPQDRIGLVSFSAGSLILSYLTEDPNNILYYLDFLKNETVLSFGTNIGRALKSGLDILAKESEISPVPSSHKRVFILVSDGEDHGKELQSAVQEVKKQGIKVHTIGVGSKEGAPIPIAWQDGAIKYLEDQKGNRIVSRFDDETLQRVAQETSGNSFHSFSGKELESAFAEIFLKEREIEGFKKVVEYEDLYHTFLLGALGFFLTAVLI